jgi:hypothetical protein
MVDPAKRHEFPKINPVFDTHFFPTVTKDAKLPVCDLCGKRIMNDKHKAFSRSIRASFACAIEQSAQIWSRR